MYRRPRRKISFPRFNLSGQPVLIPLGDIDHDTFQDAVVSVRDSVVNLSDLAHPQSYANIAFGKAGGLIDASRMITLELPEPILAAAGDGSRAEICGAGDLDGDGYDDIAIALTTKQSASGQSLQAFTCCSVATPPTGPAGRSGGLSM